MNFNNKINTTVNYAKYNYYDDIDFININYSKLSLQNWSYYDKKASRKSSNSKKNHTKLFKKEFYDKIN